MKQSFPDTTNQRWFYRNPKKSLFVVVVLLLLILTAVGEFASRILFPSLAPTQASRNFWTYDNLLGWDHQPNQSGIFKHPDFQVKVKLNSHGMRDKEYPLERTEKGRILVLGDSFGWGFGVEHEEIFSEIIERRHPEWEIINASVSGYGTDQQYLYLRSKGFRFQPDVIMLLFYENDFVNNAHSEQHWYNKPLFEFEEEKLILTNVPVPSASLKQELKRIVLGNTYLLRHLYLRFRHLTDLAPWSNESAENGDRNASMRLDDHEVTQRLLLRIKKFAHQNRAQFVIVSVPMEMEKRQILNAFAKEHNIPYLPLDGAFSKVSEPVTFARDLHWNSVGHQIAAATIQEFLIQHRLLH